MLRYFFLLSNFYFFDLQIIVCSAFLSYLICLCLKGRHLLPIPLTPLTAVLWNVKSESQRFQTLSLFELHMFLSFDALTCLHLLSDANSKNGYIHVALTTYKWNDEIRRILRSMELNCYFFQLKKNLLWKFIYQFPQRCLAHLQYSLLEEWISASRLHKDQLSITAFLLQ